MSKPSVNRRPSLKICGLTRAADLRFCLDLGVDYIGFNFYPGSKRFIEPAMAAALWRAAHPIAALGPRTPQAVAVLVGATPAAVAAALRVFPELAAIQCHGSEVPAVLASLRPLLGHRALWRAVAVGSPGDVAAATTDRSVADLVLFDAPTVPAGATVAGGSGATFSWDHLLDLRDDGAAGGKGVPWGVAGGLKVSNLEALAARFRPDLIDICSGVESAPGHKVEALVAAVQSEMARVW